MTTYTKITVITWESLKGIFPTDMLDQIEQMAAILAQEGKTDNIPEMQPGPNIVTRKWVDQQAAEDWIVFINKLVDDYGFARVPQEIKDYNPA